MHEKQMTIVRQLADRLQMSEGEVFRTAAAITGEMNIRSLYDLSREEGDQLIVYLDSLLLVGAA